MDNLKHMQSALALAKKGCGFVNPNPMVGAVIVKNGKVIGQGWHEYFGGPHAERKPFVTVRIPRKGPSCT